MGNLRFEEEENSIGTNRQERWWGIRPDGSEMEKGRKRYLKKKKKKKKHQLSVDLGTDLLSMLHYGGFVQSKIYFRILHS